MTKETIKFIEKRFPDDISFGSSGGPCYNTDIISMVSGFEQRNINWQQSRNQYNVAYGIKTEAQLQELVAFFRVCKGKAVGFRFKDWSDYYAENQFIATGDGKKKTFQLVKHYENLPGYESRKITKPVENTVKVFVDNTETKVIVDHTKGVFTFSKTPALKTIITATFEFDVPVRFDTDSLTASIEAYQTHSINNIPLVEIRV